MGPHAVVVGELPAHPAEDEDLPAGNGHDAAPRVVPPRRRHPRRQLAPAGRFGDRVQNEHVLELLGGVPPPEHVKGVVARAGLVPAAPSELRLCAFLMK